MRSSNFTATLLQLENRDHVIARSNAKEAKRGLSDIKSGRDPFMALILSVGSTSKQCNQVVERRSSFRSCTGEVKFIHSTRLAFASSA